MHDEAIVEVTEPPDMLEETQFDKCVDPASVQKILLSCTDAEVKFTDSHMHLDIMLDVQGKRYPPSLDDFLKRNTAINFKQNYDGCITSFCKEFSFNGKSRWNVCQGGQKSIWFEAIYKVING